MDRIQLPFKYSRRYSRRLRRLIVKYLTIILRARMGSESIAREAEGRMGY